MQFSYLFSIGTRQIGDNQPPFIIAEMSGNHNKSIDRAMKILELAHSCGASAIKLQTFTPETITLNVEPERTISSTTIRQLTT